MGELRPFAQEELEEIPPERAGEARLAPPSHGLWEKPRAVGRRTSSAGRYFPDSTENRARTSTSCRSRPSSLGGWVTHETVTQTRPDDRTLHSPLRHDGRRRVCP